MKSEKRFWILKYLIICLVVLMVNKVDNSFSNNRISGTEIESLISDSNADYITTDNISFSMPESPCRVPRQSNLSIPLRTFSQAQRNNSTNQSRTNGFTLTKSGKYMNVYTTSLFLESIMNFPSGMSESSHHLISLRKLII